jgi:hypothetical protein
MMKEGTYAPVTLQNANTVTFSPRSALVKLFSSRLTQAATTLVVDRSCRRLFLAYYSVTKDPLVQIIYLFVVHLTTLSVAQNIWRKKKGLKNNELERKWKETVVA